MTLPRFHLFELEDQAWLPTVIRDLGTDYIRFVQATFGLHRPILEPLATALEATHSHRVIDLCSGAGGPAPDLCRSLAARGLAVHFTLTDRFPNVPALERAAAASSGAISFIEQPVDARSVPADLRGFRTIFNSFHHFKPKDAAAILRDAVAAHQPIGIFEIPERSVPLLLSVLLTPLFVALATPFIRPFRWRRLLWTYLIPLVPLTCVWDGVVSMLRAYTMEELRALSAGLGDDSFTWQAGQIPIPSTYGHVTYLLGCPAARTRSEPRSAERP